MLTNASTAIECGGGAKATDLATQGLATMKYAATAASARATATHAGLKREDLPEATGAPPRPTVGEKLALPDRSCSMWLTNSRGVSPAGKRVH